MPSEPSKGSRVTNLFRSHPVLLLLLLSPGIPEYVSGSSAFNAVVLNPAMFVFQLLANLGLYGPGVLLIREAKIRWKKGWGSVLLLGAAYGILEEGVALSTLFNPLANPVAQLGTYGHWLGVNWVWVAGILPVHMIFSISLPILLLGLAVPEVQETSLLSPRGIKTAFIILVVDVSALFLLVAKGERFWMGGSILLGSFVTIALLVLLAYKVPTNMLTARAGRPRLRPPLLGLAGVFFYVGVLLIEGIGRGAGLPAAADFVAVVAYQALFLLMALGSLGTVENRKSLVAFASGLLVPIAVFGLVSELILPLTILPDIAMVLFLRGLWPRQDPVVSL